MDSIDFLPDRIKDYRARQRRIVCRAYLLAACFGALVLLGYVRQGRTALAFAELNNLNRREMEMQQQLQLRRDLERQQAELLIIKRIKESMGSWVGALDLLAEIERLMPESIALTDLNLQTVEKRIKSKPAQVNRTPVAVRLRSRKKKPERVIKRVRVVITGLSPSDVDVANFIGQLSASPLFEDVNMGYTKNIEYRGRNARKFQTSCYVVR